MSLELRTESDTITARHGFVCITDGQTNTAFNPELVVRIDCDPEESTADDPPIMTAEIYFHGDQGEPLTVHVVAFENLLEPIGRALNYRRTACPPSESRPR